MLTANGHIVSLTGEQVAGPGYATPETAPGAALAVVGEAAVATAPGGRQPPAGATAPRIGFESDVPRGGATERNPGGDYPTGDRFSFMRECYGAYLACPWLSAPVDVTARTVTAGGVVVEPDDDGPEADTDLTNAPTQVKKLAALIDWVNPSEDMVQLMRGVSSDLDIYGDSFTEVVWVLNEPVALYSLDAASMSVNADEHGVVTGYWQHTDNHPEGVWFEPHEVIHVSEDSPKGALYGVGFVQKAFWPATTYLFAAALLKERMRRGDPPDLHVDAPLEQEDNEYKRWVQQYRTRNIGAANIGNPVTTKGGFTIKELRASSRADLVAIMVAQRDAMVSVSGVAPHQVGIIESGNLGGGTGSSQWKNYQLNRVMPRAALIMEKFNFALLSAFGITGYKLAFGTVDYRDDQVLEDINQGRVRTGLWSLNEGRRAIGEPPVDGGDEHILVERSWAMDWAHMKDFALSWIKKNGGVNYPPADPSGFDPPNPNASDIPAPGTPPPGAPSGADDDPPEEPDDDGGHPRRPGGRRPPKPPAGGDDAKTTDPEEAWLQRVRAHYAPILEDRR